MEERIHKNQMTFQKETKNDAYESVDNGSTENSEKPRGNDLDMKLNKEIKVEVEDEDEDLNNKDRKGNVGGSSDGEDLSNLPNHLNSQYCACKNCLLSYANPLISKNLCLNNVRNEKSNKSIDNKSVSHSRNNIGVKSHSHSRFSTVEKTKPAITYTVTNSKYEKVETMGRSFVEAGSSSETIKSLNYIKYPYYFNNATMLENHWLNNFNKTDVLNRPFLTNAVKTTEKNNAFYCSKCSFQCYDISVLKKHNLIHSNTEQGYNKSSSHSDYVKSIYYMNQYNSVKMLENLSLPSANEVSTNSKSSEVKTSPVTKSKEYLKSYKCEQCSYSCNTLSILEDHQLTHIKVESDEPVDEMEPSVDSTNKLDRTNEYKCSLCSLSFESSVMLEKHQVNHVQVKTEYDEDLDGDKSSFEPKSNTEYTNLYACKKCSYQCRDLSTFQTHNMTHLENIEFNELDIKSEVIKETDSFSRNEEDHTKRTDSFICSKCSFSCDDLSILRNHDSQTHSTSKDESEYEEMNIETDIFKANETNLESKGEVDYTKLYRCKRCSFSCDDSSILKTHKLIHLHEKPYQCDQCLSSFRDAHGLRMHKLIHDGTKIYSCDECSYTCIRFYHLKIHKLTHSNVKAYKCDQCSYSGRLKSHLKRHKTIHRIKIKKGRRGKKELPIVEKEIVVKKEITNDDDNIYDKEEFSKDVNEIHVKTEFINFDEGMYDNDDFSKDGDTYEREEFDDDDKELNTKKDKVSTSKDSEGSRQTQGQNKEYKCTECPFICYDAMDLKEHQKETHWIKTYTCSQCPYFCKSKSSLRVHLFTHSEDRPYKCNQCPFACRQLANLRTHIKRHSAFKPYQCGQCPYSSSQMSALKSHRLIHSEERTYKCEICSYSCKQLSCLNSHKLKHSDVKPFGCDVCPYSCKQMSVLRRHKLKHLNTNPRKKTVPLAPFCE